MKCSSNSCLSRLGRGWLLGLLAVLLASVGMAQGGSGVEVRFVQPERFADAEESPLDRERVLAELAAFLQKQAGKRLGPDQRLLIEVLDLNLAGEIQPVGRQLDRVRVLRTVSWPAMELRFVLSQSGAVLRQGQVRLSDMTYLDGLARPMADEPLPYEKRMLDEWLSREFPLSSERR